MFSGVPRFPEHGPSGKPHIDPARRPDRFRPGGNIGHQDRGNSPGFDFPCDQTPGLVAEGSDRDKEGMGHSVIPQGGGDSRGGLRRHLIRPGAIPDEAEEPRSHLPDLLVPDHLPQSIQGEGDVHIGQDGVLRDMGVRGCEFARLHIPRQFQNLRISLHGVGEGRVDIPAVKRRRADDPEAAFRQGSANRRPGCFLKGGEGVGLESRRILMSFQQRLRLPEPNRVFFLEARNPTGIRFRSFYLSSQSSIFPFLIQTIPSMNSKLN